MRREHAALLLLVLPSVAMVVPDWNENTFKFNGSECIHGGLPHRSINHAPSSSSSTSTVQNARTTFFALPNGEPPSPEGWPVYLYFPPWSVPAADAAQVPCDHQTIPAPLTPTCLAHLKEECPNYTAGCEACVKGQEGKKENWAAAGCPPPASLGGGAASWMWCRGHGSYPKDQVFATPTSIGAGCFANKTHGKFSINDCSFGAIAGQMWDVRARQYLLANGIAVLQINPSASETWDWYGQSTWDQGFDKPYFTTLFGAIRNGTAFGGRGAKLNLDKLIVSGYSVGAQMSSWFVQLQASGQLKGLATVVGAVFFAGGTYNCYQNPPIATGQCTNCNASQDCFEIGCSQDLLARNITPCCQYCCPEQFTEQYYKDDPSEYKSHPATFLVQHSTLDENADTCAARNYHAEMLAHGGDSTMMLVPAEQERCYCLGNPGVTADELSPYRDTCSGFLPGIGNTSCTLPAGGGGGGGGGVGVGVSSGFVSSEKKKEKSLSDECQQFDSQRCVMHLMAFGGMVVPHTEFALRITEAKQP